ncbi:RNase H domain-containing protein [Trichonephila clavipes]|nr:RNase H domain-containing protein [Trichonephila clavipes]
MFELKRALSSAHNTSPGPDGISYVLLRHLSADSLVSLLYLFNRIWREQVYPTQWQAAIVISILKPGKDPKNPLSYRPIALTSCLCVVKHLLGGADRPSLLRVYQAIVLSRIDYGCVAYGSACNSTLQKLDPVHHMALRICSGAFRITGAESLC